MRKRVAVIGGGPAGMEASASLTDLGYQVTLVEAMGELGGHLLKWHHLFPSRRPAEDVVRILSSKLNQQVNVFLNADIGEIRLRDDVFRIQCCERPGIEADALLLATGFDVFDARLKEEYGYGIYDHVITSADLEGLFQSGRSLMGPGSRPLLRVGFVHCVGSRDEKCGNVHCSKVCCVTAVKQAIEIREQYPDAEVFCFYMDLRMYGLGYEELYKESQEKHGVQFIRGRLSEAFENQDGSVLIKIEDTLAGRPLRLSLDLLVLMAGIVPSAGTQRLARMLGIDVNPNGFLLVNDEHLAIHDTSVKGVFLTGACKSPRNIEETLADARSAAVRIDQYLRQIT